MRRPQPREEQCLFFWFPLICENEPTRQVCQRQERAKNINITRTHNCRHTQVLSTISETPGNYTSDYS